MSKCSVCGAKAGFGMNMCDVCIRKVGQVTADEQNSVKVGLNITTQDSSNYNALSMSIGLLCIVYGLYNLFDPTVSNMGENVANFHKLFLGQTFTIVGSLFFIAGIQKRSGVS